MSPKCYFFGPRPTEDPIKSPLSVCPSVHWSVCLSVRLSVWPSVHQSVCLSVCQFGVFLRNGSLVFSDFLHGGR